jgi:putative ABC transport system substrate-binding protein
MRGFLRGLTAFPKRRFLYALFVGLTAAMPVWAVTDILILQSHDSEPYQKTLAGFRSSLSNTKLDIAYQSLNTPDQSDTVALKQLLQTYHPKLILTLGTPATYSALTQTTKIPIVAGMIMNTDELSQNSQATGVGLSFSAAQQWQWLHRLLPDAQQIAVIYNPKQGTALFQALQKQALVDGITLVKAPATGAEDFPNLINNLPSQLDALWAVDGASTFNVSTIRELLLYSFRNRVPLIGLSSQWVKAGALYALDWDFDDIGEQAAEVAKSILLQGISPAAIPPQSPRKIRPVVNLKTAEHMKLQIPERLLSEMTEVSQ